MKHTTLFAAASLSFLLSASAVYATTSILLSNNTVIDFSQHPTNGDNLGSDITVGDINGDGKDDLLIGDDGDDTSAENAGAVYVVYGDDLDSLGDTSLANADVVFTGIDANDELSAAAVGDFNCDGNEDVLLGASSAASGDGEVYFLAGSNTAFSGTSSVSTGTVITGEASEGDRFGKHLLNAGDMNGDECDDFLVSAHNYDAGASNAGAIYLFYGASGLSISSATDADAIFTGEEASDTVPENVRSSDFLTAIGDMNGDGYDDVAIGAPNAGTRGKAYVVAGAGTDYSGAIDLGDTAVFTGDSTNGGETGHAVSGGDVNGDGLADLMIGDTYHETSPNDVDSSNEGIVHIVYGQTGTISGFELTPENVDVQIVGSFDNGQTGSGIASGADANNDGYMDILVGSTEATFTGAARDFAGGASLLLGSESLATIDHDETDALFIEDADIDNLTSSEHVKFADINGDGFAEAVIVESSGSFRVSVVVLYTDEDGDGAAGDGGLLDGTDCDDADASISQEQTYYRDSDGDGEGDPDNSTTLCSDTVPDGYVTNSDDVSGEVLGDIERVTKSNGTLTIRYANGTRTLQPYDGRKKFKYAVSVDDETLIVSNGKNVRAFVENQQVAGKKIHKKTASKRKHIRIKVKKLYRNKAYESVIVQSARKKKGRIAVLRLTRNDNLTKRKRKTFRIQKKKYMKLSTKRGKKRIIVQYGKGASKVKRVYKLKKKGKLVSIN